MKRKTKINLDELRNKVIDFIHDTWDKNCLESEDINSDTFENIASKIFTSLIEGKKKSSSPFIFRAVGQSGSGKTTQLLPAISSVTNDNFINISIRMFSQYHPHYQELVSEFGLSMIREKTNGFSLLMAFRMLELLITNGYNIIFEVTLLSEVFEKYLSILSKQTNYNIHFHVLSIPKDKSNDWIKKRQLNSKQETNRVVLESSANFFYNILPISLKYLIECNFWNVDDKIFLWSGFDDEPILISEINNMNILNIFDKYRHLDFVDKNENILLKNKINWFKNYYVKNK